MSQDECSESGTIVYFVWHTCVGQGMTGSQFSPFTMRALGIEHGPSDWAANTLAR